MMILTAISIFCAEAMVMLLIESWAGPLSMVMRAFLDATLLMVCVFPTLYFLVFKEMEEQIHLRQYSEQVMADMNYDLEREVEDRTDRLQRANDDLLVEVQERARVSMALGKALKEAEAGRKQLAMIIDAIKEGLLVVDTHGHLCLVNPQGETLLGSSAYELNGRRLEEVFSAENAADGLQALYDPEAEELPVVCEWTSAGQAAQVVHLRRAAVLEWNDEPAVLLLFQVWDEPVTVEAEAI